jgi:hypothetical protein
MKNKQFLLSFKNLKSLSLTQKWDHLGMGLSFFCLLHCLALPSLFFLLPALAHSILEHPVFHILLGLAVFPVAFLALWKGYRKHKRPQLLILGFIGVALILSGSVTALIFENQEASQTRHSNNSHHSSNSHQDKQIHPDHSNSSHHKEDLNSGESSHQHSHSSHNLILMVLGSLILILSHYMNLRWIRKISPSSCPIKT